MAGGRAVAVARPDRPLLALSVALRWARSPGLLTIRAGRRGPFDRPGRRDLSAVRLGTCLLHHLLEQDKLPLLPLRYLHTTRHTL